MKFRSRTQEHIVRSCIAVLLALLLIMRKGSSSLLDYLISPDWIKNVVAVLLFVAMIWFAFGKLKTSKK